MAAPKSQRLLATVLDRLETISPANGYETKAGESVFDGEVPDLGEDDPDDAIALIPDDSAVNDTGYVFLGIPLRVVILTKATQERPTVRREAIMGDVKRAVEIDRTLGGLVKDVKRVAENRYVRSSGSDVIAAELVYDAQLVEKWGDPT